MTINWCGQTCFKIVSSNTTVVINSPAKSSGLKKPKGAADIVLFSQTPTSKTDWEGLLKPETVVINSPGEYDLKDFFIFAMVPNISSSDQDRLIDEKKLVGSNDVSIFIIEHDRKTICHIAHYPFDILSDRDLEQIGNVDILMIPVGEAGGKTTGFNAEKAAKITNQIEPNVVIPMKYAIKGLKEELEDSSKFLKELGVNGTEAQNKMTVKKNETFSNEGTEVILLSPTI